ncbi:MAG: hypothetical protein JRM73_05045 [Nitrososphaerota archaeon]|nr:hypothetical protein [Nitrososphaerota archaeon]
MHNGGTNPHGTRASYLRPGFVLALSVRLLTSSLAILIPLFAVDVLGATASQAGFFVLLLWIGNAAGVAAAVLVVRNQSYASVLGFCFVAVSLGGLSLGGAHTAPLFMLLSGLGVGLPQPFLSAFMHADSMPGAPFSGLGLYSTALGLGLVIGPLVAYGVFPFSGFPGAFLALASFCLLGVAGAAAGRGSARGRPAPPMPRMSSWVAALRRGAFRRAVLVNFLYSLLLPVFLSYGAIYAEGRFGFTPEQALLLYTSVFALSVGMRVVAVKFEAGLGKLLLISSVTLLLSMLAVAAAPYWQLFVVGMILFSVPHAYVFPVANYYALTSAGEDVMNGSYAFQASSAAAEFLTPLAAVLLIPLAGVQGVFLVGVFLAAGAVGASLAYWGGATASGKD